MATLHSAVCRTLATLIGHYVIEKKQQFKKIYISLNLHSVPLVFLTYTKSSKDKTFSSTYYDAKKTRISQEKHLLSCFPLRYQLTSAGQSAHQGRLVGTDQLVLQRETQ